MNRRICTLIAVISFFAVPAAWSQDDSITTSWDIGADIASRYIWRGVNLSETPAFQPSIEFSWKNLTIGAWGSYTFGKEMLQEVDLLATYQIKNFTLGITDYYNPVDTLGAVNDYFNFKPKTCGHLLDVQLRFDGPESFPVYVLVSNFFYGNDRDDEGNNQYSTYFEIGYSASAGALTVQPFIGITPKAGFYYEKAGVVNLGISCAKELQITDKFNLPMNVSFITNPAYKNVYLTLVISL
jgi:hypothetical protein